MKISPRMAPNCGKTWHFRLNFEKKIRYTYTTRYSETCHTKHFTVQWEMFTVNKCSQLTDLKDMRVHEVQTLGFVLE